MHTFPEPRQGRHCYPDQTDWLVEDIYLQGTREATERVSQEYPEWFFEAPFVERVTAGMHRHA